MGRKPNKNTTHSHHRTLKTGRCGEGTLSPLPCRPVSSQVEDGWRCCHRAVGFVHSDALQVPGSCRGLIWLSIAIPCSGPSPCKAPNTTPVLVAHLALAVCHTYGSLIVPHRPIKQGSWPLRPDEETKPLSVQSVQSRAGTQFSGLGPFTRHRVPPQHHRNSFVGARP